MMKTTANRLIAAVFALVTGVVLAGCSTTPSGLLGVEGSQRVRAETVTVAAMGRNREDEPCRLVSDPEPAYPDDRIDYYVVQCGEWPNPSGWVVATDRTVAIDDTSIVWARTTEMEMTCEAGQASAFPGAQSATAYTCRRLSGGWPMFALGIETSRTHYLTYGIPAASGPVERAVQYLSGQIDEEEASGGTAGDRSAARSRAMAQLEAALGDRVYDAGDIDRYEEILALAQYNNSIGNYPASEEFYRSALSILTRGLEPGDPAFADPMMRLGLALSNQGSYRDAEAMFNQASFLAAGDFDQLSGVRLLIYRAMHEGHQGNCQAGLDHLAAAEGDLRALASEGAQDTEDAVLRGSMAGAGVELSLLQAVQASFHLCLGDTERAESLLNEALASLRSMPGAPADWEPIFLSMKAEIYRRGERFATAQAALDDAIGDRQRLFDPTRPEALDYLYRGEMLALRGEDEAAMESYRIGLETLQERDQSVTLEQVLPYLKLLFVEARAARTTAEAQAIYRTMFDIGQMVKSTRTAQAIAKVAAQLASGEDEVAALVRSSMELDRQVNEISLEIDDLRNQADAEARRPEISALLERQEDLRNRRRDVLGELQFAQPRFSQIVMKPTPVSEVIDMLGRNEALLQILLGEEESVAFIVTREGIRPIFRQLGRFEVQHAVDELRRGLTIRLTDRTLRRFDVDLSYALYETFIEPFESELSSKDHMIVVPSGPLLSLPFSVLATEPGQVLDGDYRNVSWLGRQIAISVVPSARNLADLRKTAASKIVAPQPFVGFGDFRPGDRSAAVFGPTCQERRDWIVRNASPLPETAPELLAVSNSLGANSGRTVRLGQSFTEAAVRQTELDQYRVVYFATHGLMPADAGCLTEPALITSPGPAGAPEANDGLLTMSEIMGLNLQAEMVVLSACNTGGGDGSGGESLSGLARAFFWATARSLLVSHWYTESSSARDLMTKLFADQSRNPGRGIASVLRDARTYIMMDEEEGLFPGYRSHPAFWAAFTFVGDGSQPLRLGDI